ncbi:mycothiol transferase [Actinacidiphila paucisporea]|uniref:DUF664 domain-containing protein n=1 Tax=Actinacidiphila paucisporea TaxID=310782 RepID=A0A1M7ABD8_9ACTN|nr:DUF664 domain-containing protein [Actinacidiphila paucisporea]SHL39992.1 Protein of unknown function [Actinacidiphila paucisporea]
MNTAELLADAFGRIKEVVHDAVEGLTADELADRLDPAANSVGWLVWHLTRVHDDHVAAVAGRPQTWTEDGWEQRFGLPFDAADIGYGHSPDQVAEVRVGSAELLTGYYDAVHEQTLRYLRTLTDADLDTVVDRRWNPPVTLGVRLVSVISDDLQHAGQAAFLRGILLRRRD